jgi:hypothetical protein
VTTETPGTIEPASQPSGGPAESAQQLSVVRTWTAVGLLALGIVVGVIGLFPSYLSGASLASQSYQLVPHLIYLLAWATAAVLIVTGGSRLRVGAMLGLGTTLVTFGLFFADAGTVMGHLGTAGPGLTLGLISWLACAAGSALAFQVRRHDGPARPEHHEIVPVVTLIGAAIGAAVAFAPSWDSYLLRWNFGSTTRTLGDAFSNPAAMVTGDVLVMVAVVAVVAVAALWRPVRHGGWLVIGAAVPLVAQAISAMIEIGVPTAPQTFGVSPSEASIIGLTITNGLTPMFWVFCGFVVTLALLAARMLIADGSMSSRASVSEHWWPTAPVGGWTPAVSPSGGSLPGNDVAPASAAPVPAAPASAAAAPAAANWPYFAPPAATPVGPAEPEGPAGPAAPADPAH